MFLKTVDEDGLVISTEGIQELRTIDLYVQDWSNQIWEYGYMGWSKGKDAYTKTKAFEEHQNMDLAVKRIIYRFDCNCQTNCSSFMTQIYDAKWILCNLFRYFMKELFPLGAVIKPQLLVFLTSQVDKTSVQCIYTMTQMHIWSVPYYAGCQYIECGKTICPVEKEDVKIAYDKANSRSAMLGSNHIEVLEEENMVDLTLLPKKEKNKILNQKTSDAKKAVDKAEREATRAIARALREVTVAAAKKAKKVEKSGNSKAFTSPLLLPETSIALPSQNPCK